MPCRPREEERFGHLNPLAVKQLAIGPLDDIVDTS